MKNSLITLRERIGTQLNRIQIDQHFLFLASRRIQSKPWFRVGGRVYR